MKCSAVVLLLVVVSMLAPMPVRAETFDKISITVPEGWTAEQGTDFWVFVTNTSTGALVGIGVKEKGNASLRDMAYGYYNVMKESSSWECSNFNGYYLDDDTPYYFIWDFVNVGTQKNGAAIIFDSRLDYRVNDAYYCLIMVTEGGVDAFNDTIYPSLTFNEGASETNEGDSEVEVNLGSKGYKIGKKQALALAALGGGCSTASGTIMLLAVLLCVIRVGKMRDFMRRSS